MTKQAPEKWTGRDNGYLTWVDAFANAATFFYGKSYDKDALWYIEAVKQPLAAVEIITLASLPQGAPGFAKPVMVGPDHAFLRRELLTKIRLSVESSISLSAVEIAMMF